MAVGYGLGYGLGTRDEGCSGSKHIVHEDDPTIGKSFGVAYREQILDVVPSMLTIF